MKAKGRMTETEHIGQATDSVDDDVVRFEIPEPLWSALYLCSTRCHGPCCGRKAFDFAPMVVRECLKLPSLTAARRQLDEVIDALGCVPGAVSTRWIRDRWTGLEAAQWFAEFRSALNSAANANC